jgi:hypothetical protein
VSIGVSYWQIGEKDRALDLTLNGATMTQQAVDRGVLPKSSLAVPYGNLATMYKQLGQVGDAAKYAELARVAAAEKAKAAAETDEAKTSPRASAKPNNQGSPHRMANGNQGDGYQGGGNYQGAGNYPANQGGNPNGMKPNHTISPPAGDSPSAALRARPTSNRPFSIAALSPDYYKNQNANTGGAQQNQGNNQTARRPSTGQQDGAGASDSTMQ